VITIIHLIAQALRLAESNAHPDDGKLSMTTKSEAFTKHHRYELVHSDHAAFIVYQCHLGDGIWQTLAMWMIPRAVYE
jgi:hypothetical protein